MENFIYFKTTAGHFVNQYSLANAAEICDGIRLNTANLEEVRKYASNCSGIIEEIKDPTPEMFLPTNKIKAIQLYMRQNPEKSIKECKNYIDDLTQKLKI